MVAHEVLYVITNAVYHSSCSTERKKHFSQQSRPQRRFSQGKIFTFLLPLLFHCSWNRKKNTVFSKLKLIAVSVKIIQWPIWTFVCISLTTNILHHKGINFFAIWRNWSISSQTPSFAVDESKFQLSTFSHATLVMVILPLIMGERVIEWVFQNQQWRRKTDFNGKT